MVKYYSRIGPIAKVLYTAVITLPARTPLPRWVNNPLCGPVLAADDVEEYSDAEDQSAKEHLFVGFCSSGFTFGDG